MIQVPEATQRVITNLGDAAVVLPLALLLLACTYRVSRGVAVTWAAGMAVSLGAVTVVKFLYYLGMGPLGSPSGHAAMAVVVVGGLARHVPLFCPPGWRSLAARLALVAMAASIAATRVTLDIHTPTEVTAGIALSLPGLALILLRPLPARDRPASPLPFMLSFAVVPATYGSLMDAEEAIKWAAHYLAPHLGLALSAM